MKMNWTCTFVLLSSVALGDTPPQPGVLPAPPEPIRSAFESIQEADLRAWVAFLASPELEGRESGRRGYDVASRYCATIFERYGLQPLSEDGTYFQEFQILRTEIDPGVSAFEVADSTGTEKLDLKGNLSLERTAEVMWTQSWVLVGSGKGSAGSDRFQGVPISTRVVMVLPGSESDRSPGRAAIAAGATRVAVISDRRAKAGRGLSPRERPGFDPGTEAAEPDGRPEVIYISTRAADRILRSRNVTVEQLRRDPGNVPTMDLDTVEVKLTVKRMKTYLPTRNVVGILEGSHPTLRNEVVAIGAHLDHIGTRDEKIFFGADDDASGSSGVLALLKAFAGCPERPARSILFLLFAAEEKGLWGSRYLVEHPPVPLDQFICQIQMDMIGRDEENEKKKELAEDNTNSLHLVGSKRLSTRLHDVVVSMNRYVGLDLEYDEEKVYRRSDQYHFGRMGIPVAFFFTGFHRDYHQATDTPDKINYSKMARILRLVFASAHELANLPTRLGKFKRF